LAVRIERKRLAGHVRTSPGRDPQYDR
jgi:hypothetical protein